MLGPPAVAVTDAAVHVPPITDGVATVIPAGNVSVNTALSVAAVALLLPNVSVSVDVPPLATVLGVKLLPSVGAAASTVREAVTVTGLLPRLVCSAPAGILLTAVPGVFDVTSAVIVQPPAGIVAPLA